MLHWYVYKASDIADQVIIWFENSFDKRPSVTVSKALSIYFSVNYIFDLTNALLKSYVPGSYLTGVVAA